MSESNSTNMICPKCGKFQEKADTCIACGIVIAKVSNEQTITRTQTGNTTTDGTQAKTDISRDKTGSQVPKQKYILPVFFVGVVLIGGGAAMLINKLYGGSLNTGTMRHLGWFLIPVLMMTGIGCIAQALDWNKAS